LDAASDLKIAALRTSCVKVDDAFCCVYRMFGPFDDGAEGDLRSRCTRVLASGWKVMVSKDLAYEEVGRRTRMQEAERKRFPPGSFDMGGDSTRFEA
jgi:hypothetical protein